jgi:hypothetical protein
MSKSNPPPVNSLVNSLVKPISERVKESITLLQKLQDLGIQSDDPSYKELSAHMNTWIKGGPTYQGTIDFAHYNRRAKLFLPIHPTGVAKCDFIHHVFRNI